MACDESPSSSHGSLVIPPSSSTLVVAPSPSHGDDGLPMPMVTPSVEENNDTSVQDQPWYLQQSAELSKCREFVRTTCGCSKANGKPCSSLFSEEHYVELRAQAAFLSHEQLDLVILGSVMATINSDEFCRPWHRHKPAKRQKTMMAYMHHGHNLCKKTYSFLHDVGNHRVKAIRQSYLQNGLTPRCHGNSGRSSHNALTYKQIEYIIKFIQNYAEQHAVLLPGRIPGQKRDNLKLLPSSDNKKVHRTTYLKLLYAAVTHRKYGSITNIVARHRGLVNWNCGWYLTELSVSTGYSWSLTLLTVSHGVTFAGCAIRIAQQL